MKRQPDLPDVCGIWYHGQSGVGKTTLITKLYPNAYLKRAQNKWFDGYQYEDTVVIDDLDDTHTYMSYELKKLADKFCYMVEIKNSSKYIRPKHCVVTSQYTIAEIWKDEPKTIEALERRFKQIEVTKENRVMLSNFTKNQVEIIVDDEEAEVIDKLDAMIKETEESKMQRKKFVKKIDKAIVKAKPVLSKKFQKTVEKVNSPYFPPRFHPFPSFPKSPGKLSVSEHGVRLTPLKRANAMVYEEVEMISDDDEEETPVNSVDEVEDINIECSEELPSDYDSDDISLHDKFSIDVEEDDSEEY